jgi:hypothetical protein
MAKELMPTKNANVTKERLRNIIEELRRYQALKS